MKLAERDARRGERVADGCVTLIRVFMQTRRGQRISTVHGERVYNRILEACCCETCFFPR